MDGKLPLSLVRSSPILSVLWRHETLTYVLFSSEGSRLHPGPSEDASRVRRLAFTILVTRILDVPTSPSNPNEYSLMESERLFRSKGDNHLRSLLLPFLALKSCAVNESKFEPPNVTSEVVSEF